MTTYDVHLVRAMSQSVTVEADSVADAVRAAVDKHDLSANVSNRFDDAGEVEPYNVTDLDTGHVAWTRQFESDESWEDA